ncbi:inorganic diphosphatase [Microbacterium sp. STN6]|uniref:inorganic diphosphatase n=1 Tax=Microbacterium sp. STN6 TaxID=2995588 RepID=UPI002260FA0D|nr:inorganic diphosphatase [Microbacterium sp. STN6]MCX7520873.1 inorganic diphosphatase [Microbacterium sp. STN6]
MPTPHVDVVVEIPAGCRNKYEVDHATGRMRLDRMLFTSMAYPADYGFIEGTLGKDDDPLDALVLLDEPTFPGVVIAARPVGVFRMEDEHGDDAKIIAVPAEDVRWSGVTDIDDVPQHFRDKLQHFFAHYKDLEPGKFVTVHGFGDRAEAERIVAQAVHDFRTADTYES